MKKKVLAAILTIVLAVVFLFGCGSSSGSAAAEKSDTEESVEEGEAAAGEAKDADAADSVQEQSGETEGAAGVSAETAAKAGGAAGETAAKTEDTAGETAAKTEDAAGDTAGKGEASADTPVELQVFIAASLNTSMQEVAEKYKETHPNVSIVFNADSSGKLLTQIEEGYACDVFFSAARKQMDKLEEDGLIVEGTRADVLNNQVVVIKRKDTESAVTGLAEIGKASSIALADGSVPVGRYTRTAMMNLGMLPEVEDASVYTTAEVSDALGGVEISEQGNVSQVLTAVAEGSCEVGTTYLSDTYGYEEELDIIETVSYDLTGNVIYPVCQVVNSEASAEEAAAAADFVSFITSDDAKAIFDHYLFDTNLE